MIKPDILNSISRMIVNEYRLELPKDEQFSNYAAVKKTLITAGGKYNRNGFIFKVGASEIQERLCGGEKINDKKKFQFFPTPESLAKRIVELADIKQSHRVLEPSAGNGAIAKFIKCDDLVLVELDPTHKEALELLVDESQISIGDFLGFFDSPFDRIVGNPPFTNNQDIDHIKHMYSLLADNGRLVSIASCSWENGSQKKQIDFRAWLEANDATIIDVDSGAFKESGTTIPTKIIVIDK